MRYALTNAPCALVSLNIGGSLALQMLYDIGISRIR